MSFRNTINPMKRNIFCLLGFYCLVVYFLFYPIIAHAEWPEQSCSSPHRIPVTITAGSAGHSEETRIDLTNSDFPADYIFSAAGDDIRVFQDDDITPVDFVVTGWDDSARTATIYVRHPLIAAGESELVYIYLGDTNLGTASNAPIVFPDIGIRLHSRVSSANPTNTTEALTAFAAATTDVDNSVRTSITGLNNQALGGSNGNFGWCVSAVLNVTPATAGLWEFRYGADFGRGGHLYVRGQALEEDWNSDLFWAFTYANPAQTLEGSITLPVGWHRYEALGFEGCCDGAVGFQARAPGGSFQDLSSANFPLRGAQCISTSAAVIVAAPESCSVVLDASKTVHIDSSSPSPYAVPGAIVRYDLTVSNPGQAIDSSSLSLVDIFPPNVSLLVTGSGAFNFTDGPVTSGLSFTYGGPSDMSDSVEFSLDGTNFSHTPSSPSDATVTHIRFIPTGILNPNDSGDIPSFTISLLGEVQ